MGFRNGSQTISDNDPDPQIYDSAGVYIVRLSVQGDGGTNWDYKTITVYPKPVVSFHFHLIMHGWEVKLMMERLLNFSIQPIRGRHTNGNSEMGKAALNFSPSMSIWL